LYRLCERGLDKCTLALNDARVPPARLYAELGDGARLWVVQLDQIAGDPALLDRAERERLAGLGRGRAARRYAAGRTALRIVLGAALAQDPARVPLELGPHGKPLLAGEHPLAFGLAHTGDTAVIAVARSGPLGVDVESMRPTVSPVRLANRFFDEREAATISKLAPHLAPAAFLRCWTAKEAVLKAIGTGLAEPLRGVVVNPDPREQLRLLALPNGRRAADWTLHELALARGRLALTLAIASPEARIAGVEAMPASSPGRARLGGRGELGEADDDVHGHLRGRLAGVHQL
jgi:4'-phosphopantetheinyl transferase